MPTDAKDHIARLYTLLAKLPIEEYLSSEKFAAFCREHDLGDTWKEHWETAQARPDLYGKDTAKNAFILFFHHLFQTRSREFLEILTGFLQDFQEWNGSPLSCSAIKKECILMGFPATSVADTFSKVRKRI
jgi:hypothetical protein